MIDTTTRQRIHVSTDGDAGPYIMVPVGQLEQVRASLNAEKVSYWVDEEAISMDGKPEMVVINLGHRGDAEMVQRLLDSLP